MLYLGYLKNADLQVHLLFLNISYFHFWYPNYILIDNVMLSDTGRRGERGKCTATTPGLGDLLRH